MDHCAMVPATDPVRAPTARRGQFELTKSRVLSVHLGPDSAGERPLSMTWLSDSFWPRAPPPCPTVAALAGERRCWL